MTAEEQIKAIIDHEKDLLKFNILQEFEKKYPKDTQEYIKLYDILFVYKV